MNGVGKPCAGERHARFDRGPLGKVTCTSEIERNPKVTTLCGATVSRRCDYSLNQRPTSQEPLFRAQMSQWAMASGRPARRVRQGLSSPYWRIAG